MKLKRLFMTKFINYRTKYNTDILPNHISIEITNLCNYRCKICPSAEQKFHRGVMSWETIKMLVKRINEIAGVDYITIGGLGEPTLDKELSNKIEFFRRNLGCNPLIQLHTNGSLSTKLLKKLLPNIAVFSVSVNASYPKTHEYLTKSKNYDKVLKNINLLVKLKPKYNYKLRLTMVRSNFLKQNETKLFEKRFKKLADAVVVHDDKNWGSWKYKYIKYQYPCKVIWNTLCVNWDGTVRLCTEDFNRKYNIGDIKTDSIKKIFNSKLILKARIEHKKRAFGDVIKICKECSKTQTSSFWKKYPIRHFKHRSLLNLILANILKFRKTLRSQEVDTAP